MSRENVELARRAAEAFKAGDLDVYFSHFDPDLVYHARTDDPDATIYRGRDEYRSFLVSSWLEVFEDFRPEVQEVIDAGDQTITVLTMSGRGRGSGAEVTEPYVFLRTWRGGKTVEVREFRTTTEALNAVGLARHPPQPPANPPEPA